MKTRRATTDLDHFSPEFSRDPAGRLRELRERCPVAWSPRHGGFWALTRYDDVARTAHDDATFSSARHPPDSPGSAILIPPIPARLQNPIELDPPEFYVYRRMLNPILSPQAVERLKPMIDRHVTDFLDCVIERGECDLIVDFASPVPAALTIEWLGLPLEHAERIAAIMHDLIAFSPGTPESNAAVEGQAWLYDLIRAEMAARKQVSRDDVLTYLLRQEVDGGPIPDEAVLSMTTLLIAGGVDTTTSLTGQALLYLHRNHEARRRLVEEPDLLPQATEEFLRYFCPVTMLARTVMKDVEVGGQSLSEGERVGLFWAAANRDPAEFPDPDEVVLDRFPNRHQAFGLGIHRCAGSNLARASFQAMILEVLQRIPDYRILEDRITPYPAQGVNSGWAVLPAVFTPGRRTDAPRG